VGGLSFYCVVAPKLLWYVALITSITFRKLSYSTASLNTGITTVSSTTTKMSFADGLSTDLFSTNSAMSAPLLSVFNSTRNKNPYVPGEIPPGENINRLEVENAHQVMSEQNKVCFAHGTKM
jgi:hypothetical protein